MANDADVDDDHRGRVPSRLVVVAGTYDGVLAGWDTAKRDDTADDVGEFDVDLKLLRRNDGRHLKLSFATAAHDGSIRCLDIAGAPSAGGGGAEGRKRRRGGEGDGDDTSAGSPPEPVPGTLLSGGYDETINVFNLRKKAQEGELKTPSDLGSPLCCSFAPPSTGSSSATHALVGLTSGKVVLYRRRDWSVHHVLSGHDSGGVLCLAVHPTGRMALTGGRDGRIVLWDLVKGRLAYVHKLPPSTGRGRTRDAVNHIAWCDDGSRYAFCHGARIAAREVSGGEDLLDVTMPSRVNEVAFVGGPEGMFLAAACDDGGLPVLGVGRLEEGDDAKTRRAMMAIEPVDGVVAGDDRLKCIRSAGGGSGFLVVTANSGGVVSLMDLEGAARMMLTGGDDGDDDDGDGGSDTGSDSDEEVEAAVEILDSVRIGSGARITDLAVWSYGGTGEEEELSDDEDRDSDVDVKDDEESAEAEEDEQPAEEKKKSWSREDKKGADKTGRMIEMDAETVEKARRLVGQAKKHQKKKNRKLAKKVT